MQIVCISGALEAQSMKKLSRKGSLKGSLKESDKTFVCFITNFHLNLFINYERLATCEHVLALHDAC